MNSFQDLLERQKRHFATGATRSYAWRIEQLDRMARLVGRTRRRSSGRSRRTSTLACLGEVEFQKSMLKGWMAPTEAPVPRALAATGHRGIVYRDPYGVALIVGPPTARSFCCSAPRSRRSRRAIAACSS